MKKSWFKYPLLALTTGSFLYGSHWFIEEQIQSLKKEVKSVHRVLNKEFEADLGPIELRGLPLGEDDGIVLGVKRVKIRGVPHPYNGSIIEHKGKYLLAFRSDTISRSAHFNPYFTHLGLVSLDRNFNQTEEEVRFIDTGSNYSEDPRLIKKGETLYLSYNDLIDHPCDCRTIRLAELDLKNAKAKFATEFDLHIQQKEKNWAPFVHGSDIHFEYQLNPHKILKVADPEDRELIHLTFPGNPTLQQLPWGRLWGHARGGTPSRLINGEYLAFFHSSFRQKEGLIIYVMGAYTFEAKPPFRITAISPYPILFRGIYDSPIRHTSDPMKRVIFPAGYALEEHNEKKLIHLSCGENDCALKIVTIDAEALLQSLKRL